VGKAVEKKEKVLDVINQPMAVTESCAAAAKDILLMIMVDLVPQQETH
jgi:hypothetical protein